MTITGVAALEPTNYQLTFDGTAYTLQRVDNGAVVPMTGAGTSLSPFVANGFEHRRLGHAGRERSVLLETVGARRRHPLVAREPAGRRRRRCADAHEHSPREHGHGDDLGRRDINVSNPSLLATSTIAFVNATTYTINGAGSFAYTPGADIDINGTRVQITGAPAAGDQFVIEANVGGTGDNRNIQQLIDRFHESVFNGEVSLQDATAGLITTVGSRTAEVTNQREVQELVLEQNRDRLESVRGVNLDEEAADMLKFEQLYQASARMMSVADSLFQTLLQSLSQVMNARQ